jgi:BolA protein
MTRRKKELEGLLAALQPQHLELRDRSASHAGHLDAKRKETHFHLTIVSEKFIGLSLLQRQRLVHQCVKPAWEQEGEGLHALEVKALEPKEFQDTN